MSLCLQQTQNLSVFFQNHKNLNFSKYDSFKTYKTNNRVSIWYFTDAITNQLEAQRMRHVGGANKGASRNLSRPKTTSRPQTTSRPKITSRPSTQNNAATRPANKSINGGQKKITNRASTSNRATPNRKTSTIKNKTTDRSVSRNGNTNIGNKNRVGNNNINIEKSKNVNINRRNTFVRGSYRPYKWHLLYENRGRFCCRTSTCWG